jgi:hypothetical protein
MAFAAFPHHDHRARALLRRLAMVVLLLLTSAQTSAVLGEALSAHHASEELCHSEGSTTTPGSHDAPCDPSCPCACCPGQSVTKAICAVAPFQPILSLQVLAPIGVVDLHPAEVATGIFHPPRA